MSDDKRRPAVLSGVRSTRDDTNAARHNRAPSSSTSKQRPSIKGDGDELRAKSGDSAKNGTVEEDDEEEDEDEVADEMPAPLPAQAAAPPAARNQRAHSKSNKVGDSSLMGSPATRRGGGAAGGKAGGTRKGYVASRVWKNDSTLTFGMRVKLAETPAMWADYKLAETNIVDVWEHYDVNHDDILNRSEVPQLASDLVERFLMILREGIKAENPRLSDADVEKSVKKEVKQQLPGKDIPETKRIMTDRLIHELDVDHDGTITKTEFFFQWKQTSKTFLTIQKDNKPLSCTIL